MQGSVYDANMRLSLRDAVCSLSIQLIREDGLSGSMCPLDLEYVTLILLIRKNSLNCGKRKAMLERPEVNSTG